MSRPDEGLIHEWLDGECSAEEAARIERLVATDPEWAAAEAEARGLIAASSRIVAALDAVPHAMPEGSKAAPEVSVRPAYRVRPWMKMAAGLVLVAGTAYAIREQTREVFTTAPVVEVLSDPQAPAMPPNTPVEQQKTSDADVAPVAAREAPQRAARPAPVAAAPAPDVPTTAGELAKSEVAAGAGVASAPAPAPTDSARVARRFAEVQRRLEKSPLLNQVVTTGTRGAVPERILDSPNAVSLVTSESIALECWQVTSPDSLRTMLRSTDFRPGQLDSLVVEIPAGSRRYYSLLRAGDTLRGPVTAKRVECPKP